MVGAVSVVIPTFGRSSFLNEALASVAAQSLPPHEVIVVDDCSPEPVRAHGDLKVVRHARNMGPGAARNTGIAHATGDLVLFLDDDDLLTPRRLEKAVGGIGDAYAHAMAMEAFTATGSLHSEPRVPLVGDMRDRFNRLPPPQIAQVVWRREHVTQFNPTLRAAEDKEWFLRMADRAIFAWDPEIGLRYRVHDAERRGVNPQVRFQARRVVLQQHAEDLDRWARARLAGDVASAALLAERRWHTAWYAGRSFAASPSVLAWKLAVRSVIGGGR